MLENGSKGRTYGIEAWGNAQMTPGWRVALGASTLWKDLHAKRGHLDLAPRNSLGNDPRWQVKGRSDWDLTQRLQLTLDARAVGRIEMNPEIGSYVDAGGQLAWQATEAIELFVAGRNLLHRAHLESNDPGAAQLAKRTVYAGARARF
jgi:outer membrane receptor protein involved in Fe transport